MYDKHLSPRLSAFVFCTVLASIGQAVAADGHDTFFSSADEAGKVVVAQANAIEGDYKSISNAAECLALRAKVTAGRKVFQKSDIWRGAVSTPQYKALEQSKANFRGAGCENSSGTPQAACFELLMKIEADAGAVGTTPQWQAVSHHTDFKELQDKFAKAKEIGCVR